MTLEKKTSSVLSEQEQSFIFLYKSKLLCLARRYTLSDIYVFWCGTDLLKTVQCNAEQDCAQNFSTLWELGLERLHAVPEQLLLFSFYIQILLCQTRPDSQDILYSCPLLLVLRQFSAPDFTYISSSTILYHQSVIKR